MPIFAMNTNKLHILIFALAVAIMIPLSGCRKHNEEVSAIGFTSEVTKSFVNSVDDVKNSSGISIFATRTPDEGEPTAVFNNRCLSFDSGSATGWSYDGSLEYWIPGSEYHFISIFPYDNSLSSYNVASKSISFVYESTYSSAPVDLMYAYNHRTYLPDGDDSPVPVNLNHATSSLVFKVRNVSTSPVSISNIYLSGLFKKGTCTVNAAASSISWAVDPDTKVTTGDVYTGKTDGLSNLPISTSTMYDMFKYKILAVPQQVSETDISISARIIPDGFTAYDINGYLRSNASVQTWEPGKNYIYTISITDYKIAFDVEVLDWIEHEITLE